MVYMCVEPMLLALDVKTGMEKWKFGGNDLKTLAATPVLANGLLVAPASDGLIHALEAKTGKEKWTEKWTYKSEFGGFGAAAAAAADGVFYFVDGELIIALDLKTGAKKFEAKYGSTFPTTSLAVANGCLFVGTIDGYLWAIH